MRTPYVPHRFGPEIEEELRRGHAWLTAGVASSIPWPPEDVWITYAGQDYFLRGAAVGGEETPPGITIACSRDGIDEGLAKIYRFTSVLGWYRRGYVDVAGHVWGSRPMRYGHQRLVFTTTGSYGKKSFNCNHMPILEDDPQRIALAFWREGLRLERVHDSYSFLSFYKVLESQFRTPAAKIAWINANLDFLTGNAATRVTELRAITTDVNRHLFESGRCAVAHASFQGNIVDPDLPEDRRRLSADLAVMSALAERYISDVLKIPDEMKVHKSRDHLEPWENLLSEDIRQQLKAGGEPDVSDLENLAMSVGLWPDGPISGLEEMRTQVDLVNAGRVRLLMLNPSGTICVVFVLDYTQGKVHTSLTNGGLWQDEGQLSEEDVRAWHTYFHSVIANGIVEIRCNDLEPVDCEVVIPVNIIPRVPSVAVEEELAAFQSRRTAAANSNANAEQGH